MAALDFPNAPTGGQQYTAPNGAIYTWDGAAWTVSGVLSTGSAAGGDLSGSYPNPQVISAAPYFSVRGTATGMFLGAASGSSTRLRFENDPGGFAYLQENYCYAPDDTTKASWTMTMRSAAADVVQFNRRTPGAAAGLGPTLLTLDGTGQLTIAPGADNSNATIWAVGSGSILGGLFKSRQQRGTAAAPTPSLSGDFLGQFSVLGCYANGANFSEQGALLFLAAENWSSTARGTQARISTTPVGSTTSAASFQVFHNGDIQILGGNATKASGTSWINPSDRRLKDEIADYATGLAAILQLQPRTFLYNGKGGSTAGMRGYGFVADEIAPVMPETVSVRAGKLDAADEDETDIQTLDQSNLILALVNAVKELTARVAALETAPEATGTPA